MAKNKIYNSDCIEGMKKMEDNSVDIVVADPPYNIGKDFGNKTDCMPLDKYIEWSEKWIKEAFRVLKPTGTMYIYGFSEILARLSVLIDVDKQRWLIWHYTNKNVPKLNFWQRSHEAIIACWKEKPHFNRDDVREPYSDAFLKNSAGKIRNGTKGRFGSGKETVYNAHQNGALPRDVISVSTLAGGASLKERAIYCKTCKKLIDAKDRTLHQKHELIIHPTQKPLELTEKLIKAALNKNGKTKVLVPFAGSGSECVAAVCCGAEFVGFELNDEFVMLAEERLKISGCEDER